MEGVEICELAEMDAYIKVIPAARLNFGTNEEAAASFLNYLNSEEAQAIWISYGYELAQ